MPVLSNPKHEAAAQAFIRDPARIGWRAYKAVFTECSDHAAQTAWSRLLKKPEFSARIAELQKSAADGAVMDLREVLATQSTIGRADIRKYEKLLAGGDIVAALASMPSELTAAIQEFSLQTVVVGSGKQRKTVTRLKKFKLHPKAPALAELRAHHEPQRHEHSGPNGKPIAVEKKAAEGELDLARRIAFALEKAARQPAAAAAAAPKPKSSARGRR